MMEKYYVEFHGCNFMDNSGGSYDERNPYMYMYAYNEQQIRDQLRDPFNSEIVAIDVCD
tara:strand:- start:142 stop:318 length:177 start_codon:yes stop_codon:yes gene_type:complete